MFSAPLFKVLTTHWSYSAYATIAVIVIYLATDKPTAADASLPENGLCHVKKIIDGDSLKVRCRQGVFELRLQYIDAPEITQAQWGEFAKAQLSHLAKDSIYVEFSGLDSYRRNLATIYPADAHDGDAINLELVKLGAARSYSRYRPPTPYRDAMKKAKREKRGIWQERGLHQDPVKYRRLAH